MRYIFVVQGEGRGHLTQAISLSGLLRSEGHEVVEVLVGRCSNREIPPFFVQKIGAPVVSYNSPSIDYGAQGKGGNILKTVLTNAAPSKVRMWLQSMRTIAEHIKSSEADVVVNFYEFLMGFTTIFHRIAPPIVTLAHQFIVDHPDYKSRTQRGGGERMLSLNNRFCAHGSRKILLLSFYDMPSRGERRTEVVPPLLRPEIFDLKPTDEGYVLGYMLNPAYLDEVETWKKDNDGVCDVHLFWDKRDAPELKEHTKGLWLHRINDVDFLRYMNGCHGYITTAGFESVCEALYLGKPVMMIPAHFEQEINARDSQRVGAGVMSTEYNIAKLVEYIPQHRADTASFRAWVNSAREKFLRHLTQF